MALNSNSKYGIIIGAVTLLTGLPIFILKVLKFNNILVIDDRSGYISSDNIKSFDISIIALLAVTFAILLIVGIVKKRHMLLVPWLVVAVLASVISTCSIVYDIMGELRVSDFFLLSVFIGLLVVFLYPIYNLFVDMRRENRELKHTFNTQNGSKKVSTGIIIKATSTKMYI